MKKTLKELFDFFPEINYITRNPLGYVNLFKNKPVYDREYKVYFGTPNDGIYSHDFLQVDFGILETRLNVCVSREVILKEEKHFQLNEKDDVFMHNVCMSFRHDFGLLSLNRQNSIRYDLIKFIEAINKNIGIMKHD